MEPWLLLAFGAGALFLLALAAYLFIDVYIGKKKGIYCRGKVGAQCRSMARRGGHIYLQDLTLPGDDKPVHIDHLVVGTFGVVLCNCYDYKGDLYGGKEDKSWYFYDKENRRKIIANPLSRMERCITAVRAVFAKEQVYHVAQIDSLVVFGNGVRLNNTRDTRGGVDVLLRRHAGKFLHRDKYMMEGKANPRKAAEALERSRIR